MSGKIRHEGLIDYTRPIARALLRDVRLSFGARGLFAFLWDLPEGWVIRRKHLATMGPEGLDAVSSRLRELIGVGAIYIEAIREDEDGNPIPGGRIAGKRWVLVAPDRWAIEAPLAREPQQTKESAESGKTPLTVAPTSGKPAAKVLQGVKDLQGEAAARASARTAADAAAAQKKQDQGRRRRGDETIHHGVEVWTPADAEGLHSILDRHGAERVEEVAGGLTPAAGHRAPYLSAVIAAFQALESAEAQAAAEATRQARLAASPPTDPEVCERGLHLLPAKLRDRVTSMESKQ